MYRFATLALSLSLLLGLTAVGPLLAQDAKDQPKADAKPAEPPKTDAKSDTKDQPKADEKAKAAPAAAPAEEPLPTIPPEVEAKLEAARRAVAEAIVAAQDAGLVQTTIDPPPILDILVTGRATDERQLRKALTQADLQVGVSPEVFGAWFTGYGKMQGIVAQKNVRITQPARGLKELYDQRAKVLNGHIEAVRKAKGGAPKAEEKKADDAAKEKAKADEAPKDQPKGEAAKGDEAKKDEAKKDESK